MRINIHGLAALVPTVYDLKVCNTAKETMLCFCDSCVFILFVSAYLAYLKGTRD